MSFLSNHSSDFLLKDGYLYVMYKCNISVQGGVSDPTSKQKFYAPTNTVILKTLFALAFVHCDLIEYFVYSYKN